MDERWVCKRCFHSNEGSAAACGNCGLARGSEPPAGETFTPAAEPRRPIWSWLLRFWWIGLIIVIAIAGAIFAVRRDDSGEIVGGGDMEVFDLREGDCFDLADPTEEEVNQVQAKPCSEAHEFEMYHVTDLPDGDYPSDDAFLGYFESECVPAFAEFVGTSYEESRLDIYWLTPTAESWEAGDRAIQCAVFDPLNEDLSESMEGSGV